jgi:hypothetical protein
VLHWQRIRGGIGQIFDPTLGVLAGDTARMLFRLKDYARLLITAACSSMRIRPLIRDYLIQD